MSLLSLPKSNGDYKWMDFTTDCNQLFSGPQPGAISSKGYVKAKQTYI